MSFFHLRVLFSSFYNSRLIKSIYLSSHLNFKVLRIFNQSHYNLSIFTLSIFFTFTAMSFTAEEKRSSPKIYQQILITYFMGLHLLKYFFFIAFYFKVLKQLVALSVVIPVQKVFSQYFNFYMNKLMKLQLYEHKLNLFQFHIKLKYHLSFKVYFIIRLYSVLVKSYLLLKQLIEFFDHFEMNLVKIIYLIMTVR